MVRRFPWLLIVLFLIWPTSLAAAQPQPETVTGASATITVSGTVTGPGGPVAGAWIAAGSPTAWQETTTNASGAYSLSIQTGGDLWLHVRANEADRLAQQNRWLGGVNGNLTQDWTLEAGHLLSLQITAGGATLGEGLGLQIMPLEDQPPDGSWYDLAWDEPSQRYRAVLPKDVHYVTLHTPPQGYHPATGTYDLRSSDLAATLAASPTYAHPIPYDPPDATKISVGPVDGLGEAVVTGAPGAVQPLARVLLVNLNSGHQAHTTSGAGGSFSAQLYAPPGSAIMVKHGPASHRWHDLEVGLAEGVNPFPGAIINLPHTHSAQAPGLPFAAAGAIERVTDDDNSSRNHVASAWAITGTISPLIVEGQWTRVMDGSYGGSTVPGLYRGGLNWTHPTLGDLDGDGALEMLVGERSGRLVLYHNEGNGTTPDWQFETMDYAGVSTGGWAYPALADVTADGALDLFVGTGDGRLLVFYNDGTASLAAWPDAPDVTLLTGENAAPALDDLNNDGKLDLLVGHAAGSLFHYKNTGTGASPVWTFQTDSYAAISEVEGVQPAFLDLDGNTSLDLLLGMGGSLLWYKRGGTPGNPTWTRQAADPIGHGGGSSAVSPGVGDWSGDGNPDVVTGEHWGNLRFFRNDGSSSWPQEDRPFPFDLEGDSAPALADWNDDGLPDLLLGQAHGTVFQYTNAGSAGSPDWQPNGELLTLPWTDHPHASPTLADINGDSAPELFIGEGGWPGPDAGGNIHYYRNDGTKAAPNWVLDTTTFLGLDVGGWSKPAFADINDDGDLDLFVGAEDGTLTFVENTGTNLAPTWNTPVTDYAGLDLGEFSAPAFLDIDLDGDLDMLVGLGSGSLAYIRNTGTAGSPAWQLVTTAYPGIHAGEHATPTTADLNGDSKADLVLGSGDGGLHLYLYQGTATRAGADAYAPGDPFQVDAELRIYGPAIDAGTDPGGISVDGSLALLMLHDGQGRPLPAVNTFGSSVLTPSGFPIQGGRRPEVGVGAPVWVGNLEFLGGHALGGNLRVEGNLPADLPPGLYRPVIHLGISGVPGSEDWLAAYVTVFTFGPEEAALPPIVVETSSGQSTTGIGAAPDRRLIWRLMMDDFVQGTRGTGARQDAGLYASASQIVSQGAPYYVPPVDARTGQPITYRLEPFAPTISFTDRRMPTPPLIPFDFPSGQLQVVIREPDGTLRDLGSEALIQSFNRTKTTRYGLDLNNGTVQLEDVYSLKAASDRFRTTFDQYGLHVVTMTGTIDDIWGNTYTGGGTYDIWLAQPLDIDPGVLPGTPLAVGDALNPALQFYPRLPADVVLKVTFYPDSDPTRATSTTITGQANRFGAFSPAQASPISPTEPGEYRVDLTARHLDEQGVLYMGAMTWGGVVMTPPGQADLVAHGRRGLDSLQYIPNHWFVANRDLTIPDGAVGHTLNPYYTGDVLWSRTSDGDTGGDSLVMGASVQDTVGAIEAAIKIRASRTAIETAAPGSLTERFDKGEIPLFVSTLSGLPAQMLVGQIGDDIPSDLDQIAYSYRSSQRPGVRVREVVAEDNDTGGYWRLDTLYDDQLGVGVLGDQPNDFKFQYVGAVYRDLQSGKNEYLGQGSGWIFVPDEDTFGNRVMPPFSGPGNGGWTRDGGPLLTLQNEDVHIFVLPTGTRPGAVLETGDTFRFAGHIMPTLPSEIEYTLTAPGGHQVQGGGKANPVGYFYNPGDDLIVNKAGLWTVDVRVWHNGQCSAGSTVSPYPSGSVLGSDSGRFYFYVTPKGSPRLNVATPLPGFLTFDDQVTPIAIGGFLPPGLTNAVVRYTISLPGYILDQGQVTPQGGSYQIEFDPAALHQDYPNLDLIGRDDHQPGLADTFAIGILLQAEQNGQAIYQANTITIQGEQVFVGQGGMSRGYAVYLPLILKGQK